MLAAIREGLLLAAQFNPVTALIGAVIGAVALSRGADVLRVAIAVVALAGAWYLGDGARVLVFLGDVPGATGAAGWTAVALWAIGGMVLGYVLPALAGGFVGRNVTFGTGWASAAVVAAMVTGLAGMLPGSLGA